MDSWKEFLKAILSRKFAIAFVGILALYYVAKALPVDSPVDESEITLATDDPNKPVDEKPKSGSADYLIPTYILLISFWTVGVQGYLDYYKLATIGITQFKPNIWPENKVKKETEQ